MEMKANTVVNGKTSVRTELDGFTFICEPPVAAGGNGEFPPATRMVVAALLNCIFSGFKSFCEARDIDPAELKMAFTGNVEEGIYQNMDLALTLPAGFPEKYKEALPRVLETCSVKKIVTHLPDIALTVAE